MKRISNQDLFSLLMRRLTDIVIYLPSKESKKIFYIMSQLENLFHFPNDIRMEEDYKDEL